jgi:hypothetical protein
MPSWTDSQPSARRLHPDKAGPHGVGNSLATSPSSVRHLRHSRHSVCRFGLRPLQRHAGGDGFRARAVLLHVLLCYFATQNNFRIQVELPCMPTSHLTLFQITSLCMCISMSGTVALACFFAPKVYIVLWQPYKNVRTRNSAVGKLVNSQMRFIRSAVERTRRELGYCACGWSMCLFNRCSIIRVHADHYRSRFS